MSAADRSPLAEDSGDKGAEVEVAVLGPSFDAIYQTETPGFISPPFVDQGDDLPWGARLRVRISTYDGTTLAEVVNRAADHFGVAVRSASGSPPGSVAETITGVGFWKWADDENGANHDRPPVFLGVDEEGLVLWGDVTQTKMADLRRAADAGLLDFDPDRIYLAPLLPQGGDFLASSWSVFWEMKDRAVEALILVGGIHGGLHAIHLVVKRLGRFEALRSAAGRLVGRNGGPAEVLDLLQVKPWAPPELAQRLGVSEDAASEIVASSPFGASGLYAELLERLLVTFVDVASHPSPEGILMPEPEWFEESLLAIATIIEATGEMPTDDEWRSLTIMSWYRHHDERIWGSES